MHTKQIKAILADMQKENNKTGNCDNNRIDYMELLSKAGIGHEKLDEALDFLAQEGCIEICNGITGDILITGNLA